MARDDSRENHMGLIGPIGRMGPWTHDLESGHFSCVLDPPEGRTENSPGLQAWDQDEP
jgi:hypothetical protein